MTDFRALCQELLQGLDENRHPEVRYPGHLRIVMAHARALLAQPEPQGPTDEELCKFFRANDDLMRHCEAGTDWNEPLMTEYEFPAVARAVLAHYGRPAIEPVPGVEGKP
jgi:hypothetical protein